MRECAAAGVGLAGAMGTGWSARARTKPNIVIIMADDMGFADIGCYGSEIQTPNLDRLSGEGMRFTSFYNCARCCPTRASLLTGLYSHRAGMGAMVNERDEPRTAPYQGFLNDRCLTIAEALKPAGYRTCMSGKWHVGEKPEHWPLRRGFDHYYGLISGASSYFDPNFVLEGSNRARTMVRESTKITEFAKDFYMTDAITESAVGQLGDVARTPDPFFLYVAYTAPHWPLHARPEDIRKYQGKYVGGWDQLRQSRHARLREMGLLESKWQLSRRDDGAIPWDEEKNKEWQDRRMAVYAAQIDRMDQGIGRILDTLKEKRLVENTLVLFLADNGACAENAGVRRDPSVTPGGPDSYMAYGVAWANASNTPFRRYKQTLYEGGISTPLIARWPGMIRPGSKTEQVGHVIDLTPTCLEVAGAPYKRASGPDLSALDGKSLLPVLKGGSRAGHEIMYWEHIRNRALRQGDWKIVWDRKIGAWELYNVVEDRTETRNLASDQPERTRLMAGLWEDWANSAGVQFGKGPGPSET